MNEWVKRAKSYATAATLKANSKKYGKYMKGACKRFLADLARAGTKKCDFYFNADEAANACEFISNLPHVEGRWGTDTIKLEDFQVFFLVNLFGFRKPDGSRRFTSALFCIARKNAKTTLAAGIGLYCLTMEGEQGPQTISGATTGDQARIVFEIGKKMVQRTPDLADAFRLEAFSRSIACYNNGGIMRAINSKASTQDGLNPSCVILDEIHAHKTPDLMNVLQSAAGARRNPLFLYTTTEGYESPGPWPELRHFAQQVLEGVIQADHFLAVIFAIDKKDDEFDSSVWIKANPLIENNDILFNAIKKDSIDAKAMPSRHSEFLIKRVNRSASSADGWIDLHKWRSCAGKFDLEEFKDEPCWGALDLASTRDLTSFRLVWLKKGKIYTHGWRWVPKTTVQKRMERNLVPYWGWVKSGHLIETPGEVTDYDAIFEKVKEADQQFKIVKIGYDPWNAAQMAQKIKDEDIEVQEFIQGPKSYHPPMKKFEEAYHGGNFCHNGDPVLTWCASNIVARRDANMNMAPNKRKSAEKIDDITAMLMAIGVMIGEEKEEDVDDFIGNPIIIK